MNHNDIKISENVTVRYFPEKKFKSNFINVNFIAPLSREFVSERALLFEVLTRGCEKYPTLRDINTRLDDLYGMGLSTECEKRGKNHIIGLSLDMLCDACVYDGTKITLSAIDLLSRIIKEPLLENGAFRADYVEGEKAKLCEKIESAVLNKMRYALKGCSETMFEGEIYGIGAIGDKDGVKRVTPASLFDCYRKMLREDRVEIYCIGTFSEEDLSALSEVFTGFATEVKSSSSEMPEPHNPSEIKLREEIKEINQATMAMGFSLGDSQCQGKKYSDIIMMNSVFGQGTISKLFTVVREKMSLCYYCHSVVTPELGALYVVTGIDIANIEKTKEAVLSQIEEIKKGNISDDELNYSKNDLITSLRSVSDSAVAIKDWNLGKLLRNITTTPEKEIESIKTVTKEDVSKCAEKIKLDTVFILRNNKEKEAAADE